MRSKGSTHILSSICSRLGAIDSSLQPHYVSTALKSSFESVSFISPSSLSFKSFSSSHDDRRSASWKGASTSNRKGPDDSRRNVDRRFNSPLSDKQLSFRSSHPTRNTFEVSPAGKSDSTSPPRQFERKRVKTFREDHDPQLWVNWLYLVSRGDQDRMPQPESPLPRALDAKQTAMALVAAASIVQKRPGEEPINRFAKDLHHRLMQRILAPDMLPRLEPDHLRCVLWSCQSLRYPRYFAVKKTVEDKCLELLRDPKTRALFPPQCSNILHSLSGLSRVGDAPPNAELVEELGRVVAQAAREGHAWFAPASPKAAGHVMMALSGMAKLGVPRAVFLDAAAALEERLLKWVEGGEITGEALPQLLYPFAAASCEMSPVLFEAIERRSLEHQGRGKGYPWRDTTLLIWSASKVRLTAPRAPSALAPSPASFPRLPFIVRLLERKVASLSNEGDQRYPSVDDLASILYSCAESAAYLSPLGHTSSPIPTPLIKFLGEAMAARAPQATAHTFRRLLSSAASLANASDERMMEDIRYFLVLPAVPALRDRLAALSALGPSLLPPSDCARSLWALGDLAIDPLAFPNLWETLWGPIERTLESKPTASPALPLGDIQRLLCAISETNLLPPGGPSTLANLCLALERRLEAADGGDEDSSEPAGQLYASLQGHVLLLRHLAALDRLGFLDPMPAQGTAAARAAAERLLRLTAAQLPSLHVPQPSAPANESQHLSTGRLRATLFHAKVMAAGTMRPVFDRLSGSDRAVREALELAEIAFRKQHLHRSKSAAKVWNYLTRRGSAVDRLLDAYHLQKRLEFTSPDGLMRADAALFPQDLAFSQPDDSAAPVTRITIEFDGPMHFLLPSKRERGRSAIRARLGQERGWKTLVVDLESFAKDSQREETKFVAAMERALFDAYGPAPRAK